MGTYELRNCLGVRVLLRTALDRRNFAATTDGMLYRSPRWFVDSRKEHCAHFFVTRSKRLGRSPLGTNSQGVETETDHSAVSDIKLPVHLHGVVSMDVGHCHSLAKTVADITVTRDSAVSKATGYELDGVGVGVRVHVGSIVFFSTSGPVLGPIQAPL
jgi:hypothetical protein